MNIFESEVHFNKKSSLEFQNSSHLEQLLLNIDNFMQDNSDPFCSI